MESEAFATESSLASIPNDENAPPEERPEGGQKKRKTHRLKQRFTVVRKLGQGTYGKVQLAINNETGLEVAIKTIKKSKVESEKDLIRIRREIQIMSSIQHPHLVHIYEVFENKDKIVLVMQYASGGELYDYVSYHKVLTDSDARRIFRQVATAIYYCHKNKICHRDLKLENILLDEKGNAKIADFGLSNVFDERHFLQTFCGSPLYASPEIVKGQPYFGPEVDCWSLGVLLYTLVYGAMPFDGSNFKKLVKQISESNYYEPPEKSSASDLIRRLLAPNPRERATIIDICLDPWVNYDFDHSLLQLADDLSNLTPVRCDMIAALAPVSPGIVDTKPTDGEDNQEQAEGEPPIEQEVQQEAERENDKPIIEQTVDEQANILDEPPAIDKHNDTQKNESTIAENNIDLETSIKDQTSEMEAIPKSVPETDFSVEEPESKTEIKISECVNEAIQEVNDKTIKAAKEGKKPSVIKPAEKSPSPEKKTTSVKSNRSSSSSIAKSDSAGRRPGRLSIPKIWDSSTKVDKTPTDSPTSLAGSGSQSSFIPVCMRVNEAKKALERRCSVNVNRPSSLLKRRDSTPAVRTSSTTPLARPPLKKYNARSFSLNENEMSKSRPTTAKTPVPKKPSPPKVVEAKSRSPTKSPTKVIKQISPEKTPPVTPQSSTPSTPITEEDKSLAKQIIKKNIAKVMDKQKSDSSETIGKLKVRESPSASSTIPETESISESVRTDNQSQQLISQPITRSYKKVTFTKDGACITESGKVYTHKSKDGFGVKRIEKKSMVTHIIQGGNGNANNNSAMKEAMISGQDVEGTVTLQKSDSASSTGSTDIFDDIFEDHWTGDVFSNVKSIFNNIFENSNRRIAERRSIRSRAESLERPNDWFNRRFAEETQGSRFSFDKEDEDSGMYVNESQKSIFSNRSMFSSNFKSNFDKEFESMASSRMQSVSAKFNEKFKLLGKMDSLFDCNRQESSQQRVEKWLQSDESQEKDDRMRIENYGTIGPKNFRRYIKTMNSTNTEMEERENGSGFSNQMFKSQKSSVQMSSSSMMSKSNSRTVQAGDEVEFKVNPEPDMEDNSKSNNDDDEAFVSAPQASAINVEGESSLLEQLRKFGYKKIIDRKLSESSSTEDATQESGSKIRESNQEQQTMERAYSTSGGLSSTSSSAFMSSLRTRQQSIERMRPEFISRRSSSNRQEFQESSIDSNTSPPRYSSSSSILGRNSDSAKNESVMERIHRKSYYSRFNDLDTSNSGTISDRTRRRSITRPSDTMSDIHSISSTTSANNSSSNVRGGYGSPLILMNNSGQSPFSESYRNASTSSLSSSNNQISSFSSSLSKTMKESSTSSSYVIYQTSKTVKSSSSRSSTLFNSSTQNSTDDNLTSGDNVQDQIHKRITSIKREFSSSSNNNNNSQQ